MNILEELKLSKKQSNDERYEYLCSQFNAVDYAMKLEKYTIKLQQENQQLKEEVSLLDMRTDENIKLQNNWNELKKWLGTRINTDKNYERNSHIKEKLQVEDYVIKQVMFFMQELEGNNE